MRGDVRFDYEALRIGRSVVVSNGHGVYTCYGCGHTWHARSRRLWWPIGLGWHPGGALHFFDWHGVVVGWDAIEQRQVAQVFHVGALKIRFGFRRVARRASEHGAPKETP